MLAPRTATAAVRADAAATGVCERTVAWLSACAALERAARGARGSSPPRCIDDALAQDFPELARALYAALHGDSDAADLALGTAITLADEMALHGCLSLAHSALSYARSTLAHTPLAQARALAALAGITARLGDHDAAREQAIDARRIGRALRDMAVQGRACLALGLVSEMRGNTERAGKRLHAALRVSPHETGITRLAHLALVRVDATTGDPDDAMLRVARAFRFAEATPDERAELLVEVAAICRQVGRPRIARQTALAAIALAGSPVARLRAQVALVLAASALDDRDEVMNASREAESLANASNEPFVATTARVSLAEALVGVGAIEDAVRLAWIASLEAEARGYELLLARARRATDEETLGHARRDRTAAPHGCAVSAMLDAVGRGGVDGLFCLLSAGAA